MKYFRGGVRVVMRWSAKPFTRVRFSPTSPSIAPLKNWQKGLDLTSTLCYNLCHDKSNTDINCGEFDHTYYRANGGLIPTVVGENT